MTENQKNILLKIAKDNIVAAVNGRKIPAPKTDDPALLKHQGCFVTIKNNDRLRGCIGQFTADQPLIEIVAEMAVSAARRDPRFVNMPITQNELDKLDIEISVLSELKKTDDPLTLRLGVDGIYICKGYNSGCFLPQVATETGWSKEEFLNYCCEHKAALPADAWRDDDIEVFLFTCEVFGKDLKNIL